MVEKELIGFISFYFIYFFNSNGNKNQTTSHFKNIFFYIHFESSRFYPHICFWNCTWFFDCFPTFLKFIQLLSRALVVHDTGNEIMNHRKPKPEWDEKNTVITIKPERQSWNTIFRCFCHELQNQANQCCIERWMDG